MEAQENNTFGTYVKNILILSYKNLKELTGAVDSDWICEEIDGDNCLFFFDTRELTGHWTCDVDCSDQLYLNNDEIRVVTDEISRAFNKVKY